MRQCILCASVGTSGILLQMLPHASAQEPLVHDNTSRGAYRRKVTTYMNHGRAGQPYIRAYIIKPQDFAEKQIILRTYFERTSEFREAAPKRTRVCRGLPLVYRFNKFSCESNLPSVNLPWWPRVPTVESRAAISRAQVSRVAVWTCSGIEAVATKAVFKIGKYMPKVPSGPYSSTGVHLVFVHSGGCRNQYYASAGADVC